MLKINTLSGGILGGGGGGGGDDDDDDFGLTRFLGSATDYVTDFFGGDSSQKKKPNEDIKIDRKNDEKPNKKPEIVKKTPKNSASKLKAEADDQKEASILETIGETIEELTADEEQPTDSTTEKTESTENEEEHEDEEQEEKEDKEYEEENDEDDVSAFK